MIPARAGWVQSDSTLRETTVFIAIEFEPRSADGHPMERRESYRVKFDVEQHDLQISLSLPGRADRIECELVDLTRHGVGVRIAAGRAPPISADERVRLHFTGEDAGELPAIAATVRSVISTPSYFRYGLRFEACTELREVLPERLLPRFNQRVARRVRPPSALRVELYHTGSERISAVIRDISWSGMSVLVPIRAEYEGLSLHKLIELRFSLPGTRQPLQLIGEIQRDLMIDELICYGIRFDAQRTSEFPRQQNVLKRYIARCYLDAKESKDPPPVKTR